MATTKKNAAAVALGRLGGLKGGKARAAKLKAEQRREIAKKAARGGGAEGRGQRSEVSMNGPHQSSQRQKRTG